MYDSELIKIAKKYIYDNTNYSIEWINSLTSKMLLAIYFNLKNKKRKD